VGASRGGRNTKIHGLSDPECRPVAFHLTGGQVADITGGEPLAQILPRLKAFIADKAYDCARLRTSLEKTGTKAVIPNKVNRKAPFPFNGQLYKNRNTIERMFCRLKDFRRIATRYDKLAQNFLSALCIAAAIAYWIN
jgi:transposase